MKLYRGSHSSAKSKLIFEFSCPHDFNFSIHQNLHEHATRFLTKIWKNYKTMIIIAPQHHHSHHTMTLSKYQLLINLSCELFVSVSCIILLMFISHATHPLSSDPKQILHQNSGSFYSPLSRRLSDAIYHNPKCFVRPNE